MSEEEHPGLLDDDPALDYILYKEMVKDEKRSPKGKGGCLSLILIMIVPVAGALLLLLLFLSVPPISSAAEKPDNYCDDQNSWQQWEKLLSDNLGDDGIASLYAFRVGLCSIWSNPDRSTLNGQRNCLKGYGIRLSEERKKTRDRL